MLASYAFSLFKVPRSDAARQEAYLANGQNDAKGTAWVGPPSQPGGLCDEDDPHHTDWDGNVHSPAKTIPVSDNK